MEKLLQENNKTKLKKAMDGVIKKGKEAEWLNTSNGGLGNRTPLEIMSEGSEGIEKVLALLNRFEWGIPS